MENYEDILRLPMFIRKHSNTAKGIFVGEKQCFSLCSPKGPTRDAQDHLESIEVSMGYEHCVI